MAARCRLRHSEGQSSHDDRTQRWEASERVHGSGYVVARVRSRRVTPGTLMHDIIPAHASRCHTRCAKG